MLLANNILTLEGLKDVMSSPIDIYVFHYTVNLSLVGKTKRQQVIIFQLTVTTYCPGYIRPPAS
jgi:hypothetical protein